jgi:hypothetical protein
MLNILNPPKQHKPTVSDDPRVRNERRLFRHRTLSAVFPKEPVRDTDIEDWLDMEELEEQIQHDRLSAARARTISYSMLVGAVIAFLVFLAYVGRA